MIAQGAGVDVRDLRAPREAVAFEAARAFGHVKRLGYPRRVATPQERRAARYILRTFAALGLGRRRETFPVPLLAREVGTRVVFAVCAIAVLLGAWVVTKTSVDGVRVQTQEGDFYGQDHPGARRAVQGSARDIGMVTIGSRASGLRDEDRSGG